MPHLSSLLQGFARARPERIEVVGLRVTDREPVCRATSPERELG